MAMGTVPCLLWKWWTWWVVLREDDTLAATAGHGNTSSARESTSLNRKAGLAHTTGDTAAGGGTSTNPSSTSTSTSACCAMRTGPGMDKRPLPLIRHKQEESISKESGAHRPLLSSQGNEKRNDEKVFFFFKEKKSQLIKMILLWKLPQTKKETNTQKTSSCWKKDSKIPPTA